MTGTPKPAPVVKKSVYTPVKTQTEFADNVTSDQLFASSRVGCDRVACWVPKDLIGEYKGLRWSPYQFVDPDDVEELHGGATRPSDKDFGVFVKIVDGDNRITLASPPHLLMWTYKQARDERQANLQKLGNAIKPNGSPTPTSEGTTEKIMTIEELRGSKP